MALDDTRLQLRQYSIRFKKSGTRIPRVVLAEMGPRVSFSVRRYRLPPTDLQQEALKQPKLGKKKVRHIGGRRRAAGGSQEGNAHVAQSAQCHERWFFPAPRPPPTPSFVSVYYLPL